MLHLAGKASTRRRPVNSALGVMTPDRAALLRDASKAAGLPEDFAAALLSDAPWLDAREEISEDLAPQLLADAAVRYDASLEQIRSFASNYNALVSTWRYPSADQQTQAYGDLARRLKPFGKESGMGDGDFWLVEDSFSTRTPTIQVFRGFEFPDLAHNAVERFVHTYRRLFDEVRICNQEGDLLRVVPR